jgi:D-arabinose 1-dehydrogenase-like Zn-dependent alcohol dehydrogenase
MGFSFLMARAKQPPYVADIDPKKRALALERGAAAAYDPADPAARKALIAATGGVAGAVDFAGSEQSAAFAFGSLGRGGQLVIAGLFGGEFKSALPTFPLKGVAVIGNYVGSLAEAKEMLALVKKGGIAPIPTHERPLAEAGAALDDLRAGRTVGRTVLVP